MNGAFERRDAVRLLSLEGREIGRGLCALSSAEVAQVLGLSSRAAQSTLDHNAGSAVVHRDHLVLTAPTTAPG